ncbi:hypothetical protein V8C86DRAFT_3091801 [Haematococcus lacustris]
MVPTSSSLHPAQPSPAQPSPAQPSPAQPSPAQPSPAQPSPAQPSPAQPSPAQPSPAQPSPAQPSPAQPSPAQPSPAQPSPAQPSPAQPSPAQPSPAQPSPAQPSPAQPSPAQPSPAQPSPAQPSPAQPSPAQPSPAQPSPAQPSPAQPSPAQPSPAQPSPALPPPPPPPSSPYHKKQVHGAQEQPGAAAMEALPALAEFAVNNSWQESIQSTPFLAAYANKARRDVEYKVGQKVLLSTKNLKLQPGKARKLIPRYVGPFEILLLVGAVAVKLDLPASMSRLHPVFHVSLIKPYTGTDVGFMPPPVTWMDETPVYYVERLLDHKGVKDNKASYYLVQWEGYDSTHNTWEPRSNLTDCDKILAEYNAIHHLK